MYKKSRPELCKLYRSRKHAHSWPQAARQKTAISGGFYSLSSRVLWHTLEFKPFSLFTTGGWTSKGVQLVHIYNARPVATSRERCLCRFGLTSATCAYHSSWLPHLISVIIIPYSAELVNTFLIFFLRFLGSWGISGVAFSRAQLNLPT
jgi:hypothetical protein